MLNDNEISDKGKDFILNNIDIKNLLLWLYWL